MLGRGYRRIAYIIGPSYLPTLTPTPACPQLTTVRQPMDAFGVSLATLVLDQIEDRPFQRTGLLTTEVVARQARRERFSIMSVHTSLRPKHTWNMP